MLKKFLMTNFRLLSSLLFFFFRLNSIVSMQVIPGILFFSQSAPSVCSCVHKNINLKAKQQNPLKQPNPAKPYIYI